jgi:hypothetical protein
VKGIRADVDRGNSVGCKGAAHGWLVRCQKYHPYLSDMLQRPFIIIGTIIVVGILLAPYVLGIARRLSGRSPKDP